MIYRSFVILAVFVSSCYSFKGISIAPTIESFYIPQFQNAAHNAPPDVHIIFTEALRDIVLQNSRLSSDEDAPDIEFVGAVRSFTVTSVAPQSREESFGSALNRLTIAVAVEYVNHIEEEENWEQTFSFFQDYESSENLVDVQDELIGTIFDQITQDIFNKAFTNW